MHAEPPLLASLGGLLFSADRGGGGVVTVKPRGLLSEKVANAHQ